MRSLLTIVGSFAVTIVCWGMYGPVLLWGQAAMADAPGDLGRLRPFVCVGLAYFAIGVLVPAVLLKLKGEQGEWTVSGIIYSFAGGALGALGALGILLAFYFGGKPVFVMPLVFGGAPVVNSLITISLLKRIRDIGPLFLAGLMMVLLGAVIVLVFAPHAPADDTEAPVEQESQAVAEGEEQAAEPPQQPTKPAGGLFSRFLLQIVSILCAIGCWGAYGPVLHRGQEAMKQSRLRPLLCVGLAYFVIAVLVPNLLLTVLPEASHYSFSGTLWSFAAGAAGAIGALGIIMAFHFGGRPVYVMPLVFGGAPVVNTLLTTSVGGLWSEVNAFFLAGLILVIAGGAIVLVFAPKSPPTPSAQEPAASPPPDENSPPIASS